MLLEVLLSGGGKLDGSKLESTLLEAADDGANESTLDSVGLDAIYDVNWDIRVNGFPCGAGKPISEFRKTYAMKLQPETN